MKRVVLHIILVLSLTASKAQVLLPMGHGLPAAPSRITDFRSNIVAAYGDIYQNVQLEMWNGDFWQKLPKPQVPKLETNANGEYEILDLITFNNNLYLLTGYETKLSPIAQNHILRWDGQSWTDLSDGLILESESIVKLFVENNSLKCVGKFFIGSQAFNIVRLEGDGFVPEGNAIASRESDKFNTIVYTGNQLIATGKFTTPAASNVTLAVWDGATWKPAQYPPFLGQNLSIGTYANSSVVFGTTANSTDRVKRFNNGLWENMSQGLEKFEVSQIDQFAEVSGNLLALGKFKNLETGKQTSLMLYNGLLWDETNINIGNIEQINSINQAVLVSGDFNDNARLRGIGALALDKALIVSRIFNDKNGNCEKDANEEWMPSYPTITNKHKGELLTDLSGQLYLTTELQELSLNAGSFQNYEATCPDFALNVTEYKTYYGVVLGVKKKTAVYDGEIHLSDMHSYVAINGESRQAKLVIKNIGSLPIINGKLTLELGAGLDNFTSQIAYDLFINDKVHYTLTIGAGESTEFFINYTISDVNEAFVKANLTLATNQEDENLANNGYTLAYSEGETQFNYKNCGNGKIIDPNTQAVSYKINFKNLNDRNVVGVKIVDVFDPNITIKGAAYIGASDNNHSSEWTLEGNSHKVVTTLNNITLTPSSVNDEQSTGFVDYRLELLDKSLIDGMKICNSAKIYFSFSDGTYDEAFITNTVCSDVSNTVGITNGNSLLHITSELSIGPNPTSDYIRFENSSSNDFNVSIVNSLGQEVSFLTIGRSEKSSYNAKHLESGVYAVYVDGIFAKKIVLAK